MMMPFRAIVFAECVADRIVGRGDGMNDAFVGKGLQGTVHRYPVEAFTGFFFNIAMRQGAGMAQEKIQDLFAAGREAQAIAF